MSKSDLLKALSRRKFLRNSVVAVTGAAVAPSLLSGCSDDDETPLFVPEGTESEDFGFLEGVASFDPSQNQVVLWSRYTADTNETGNPTIILDVATDSAFSQIVASESVVADSQSDNTIIVDMEGLDAGTKYYYRFRNDVSGSTSITGETNTLPTSTTEVKLAVVSCANFRAGLFNVYGAVAASDADIVVHLGDYIYEYGSENTYGTDENGTSTSELGREHSPNVETITIEDYRARYRQYRTDAQLQEAHRLKPFICVWDDHEIANDTFKDGAENHQEDEGSFETRKANALQVWHEYLPARVSDNSKIYRNFEIGGLVNLMMLDTRIVGRDQQLDYANYPELGIGDSSNFISDLFDANRTILGSEQRSWLGSTITNSSAEWNVLGSQVLMAKYYIPAELLLAVAPLFDGTATDDDLLAVNALLAELAGIKGRILAGDPTVTDAERARVETTLPYNLDAWDGYAFERETILGIFKEQNKKMISIAGDTHNAWHSKQLHLDLLTLGTTEVGTEFATSSVSSPGFEGVLGTDPAALAGFEQALTLLINDLQYLDSSRRGFLKVTFTSGSATAEWNYSSQLSTVDTDTTIGNTATVS